MMIAIAHQAVGGGNPERAVGIFRQRVNGVVHKFRCVEFVEHGKAHAIETSQSAVTSDVQVALAGLRERANRALREALFSLPRLEAECPRARGKSMPSGARYASEASRLARLPRRHRPRFKVGMIMLYRRAADVRRCAHVWTR